jgi:dihydrofolate reductase
VFDSVSGVILSRPMVAEGYLGHWKRTAELRPDDPDYRFARRIGELPKFVISSRSLDSRWPNTTVVTADISDAVRRAKTETSGDLVCFGGAGFVNAALRRDLVDELQLFINPGIAGAGTRIFDSSMTTRSYELADAVPYECGIVVGRWTRPTVA